MSGHTSQAIEPRVLLEGLAIGESPRWHDGRLWLSNWGTGEIVAIDLDGSSEVGERGPEGLGWATDWLPDGRMLITGGRSLSGSSPTARASGTQTSATSRRSAGAS